MKLWESRLQEGGEQNISINEITKKYGVSKK